MSSKIQALLGIVVLNSVLIGCGGSGASSAQSGSPDQAFSFGPLVGRATSVAPPISVSGTGATLTAFTGVFPAVKMLNPTSGPGSNQIAFVSDRLGTPQIFLMDDDGGNQRQLTSFAGGASSPAVSPDGTKIAFLASPTIGAPPDIYTISIDGTGISPLVANAAVESDPSWSPDGSHLAFVSNRTGAAEVFAVDVPSKVVTKLTNIGGCSSPVYSPDGTKITFSTYDGTDYNIWVMDSNGANLTSQNVVGVGPRWTSGGKLISYGDPSSFDIDFINYPAHFGAQTMVTDAALSFRHAWSPDGTEMAYENFGQTGIFLQLVKFDPVTFHKTQLTDGLTNNFAPSWGPSARSRVLIGTGGMFQATSSGFILGQSGDLVSSFLAFAASTPSTADVKTSNTGETDGTNVTFSIDADNLTLLSYSNDSNLAPVKVIGPGSPVNNADGCFVSYNSATGDVVAILPFAGSRAADSKVFSVSGGLQFEGDLLAVFDGSGKNIAPNGARVVRLDSLTGHLQASR